MKSYFFSLLRSFRAQFIGKSENNAKKTMLQNANRKEQILKCTRVRRKSVTQ